MIKITNINSFNITDTVVTVGTFDGLHLGHKTILNALKDKAKQLNSKSVVFTFWPHPRFVLGKIDGLELLSTIDEKSKILEKYGVDYLVSVEFTKEFASQTSYEFVKNILAGKLNVKHLVLGYDHHFGKNREGRFDKLAECANEFGFTIEQVSALTSGEENISSTKIRNALKLGDIAKANKYLGYNYSITGKVVRGEAIGRKIGFPTANIKWESYKLIPANGVYAVKVHYKNVTYNAMVNVGRKPTVSNNEKTGIEVNIFDFDKNIYDKKITIEFIERIRNEQKFENIDKLKAQLKLDKKKTLHLFGKLNEDPK